MAEIVYSEETLLDDPMEGYEPPKEKKQEKKTPEKKREKITYGTESYRIPKKTQRQLSGSTTKLLDSAGTLLEKKKECEKKEKEEKEKKRKETEDKRKEEEDRRERSRRNRAERNRIHNRRRKEQWKERGRRQRDEEEERRHRTQEQRRQRRDSREEHGDVVNQIIEATSDRMAFHLLRGRRNSEGWDVRGGGAGWW